MKYQEEVSWINKSLVLLQDGMTREDIDDYLLNNGVKKWNVKKVNLGIDKQLRHKYKDQIRTYMLDNTLEEKIEEFDLIDADLFEKIQYEIIAEFRTASRTIIRGLIKEGKNEEEIVYEVENQFFDAVAIVAFIDSESSKIADKRNEVNKGLGFIGLGVLLSIVTSGVLTETTILFHGLVIYGIVILYNARS